MSKEHNVWILISVGLHFNEVCFSISVGLHFRKYESRRCSNIWASNSESISNILFVPFRSVKYQLLWGIGIPRNGTEPFYVIVSDKFARKILE